MTKKVTSITFQPVAEGLRESYVYSELNDDGDIISSNNRASFIVQNETILELYETIKKTLES